MLCPGIVETRIKPVGGAIGEHVLCKHAREQAVHPADRVADRHRAERVAVVAAAHGQQPPYARGGPSPVGTAGTA